MGLFDGLRSALEGTDLGRLGEAVDLGQLQEATGLQDVAGSLGDLAGGDLTGLAELAQGTGVEDIATTAAEAQDSLGGGGAGG
jgi:hypothetical protein